MIQLRPYQTDLVTRARALMQKGCHSILLQSPTGSGKTALTAHMLHTAANKGMRSMFVVHRRELLMQSRQAFLQEGLNHGIIAAGFDGNTRPLVQIASVQTLARRLTQYAEPALIVWDECHHIAAKSWEGIFKRFERAYHIGLTATPQRLDGRGLSTFFKEMIQGPSVHSLIEQGYLSPYRLYAPMTVKVDDVHTSMGDYVKSELSAIVDKPSITGDVVAHYRKYAHGKRALVFCVSVAHSTHVAAQFCANGYQARHVDGDTPTQERDDAMRRFKDGNIQILTSVDIFGEGVDVPSLECVVLCRPTTSVGLHLQQLGRALRPAPGKTEAIILDTCGNTFRHGLPDEDREWSLEGRERRKNKGNSESLSVRICPACFAAQESERTICRFCGCVFEIKGRKILEKEGELSEVDIELLRRQKKQEQGSAQSLEELTQIGIARKYKFPRRWAYHVFKSRLAKRLHKETV